MAEFEANGIILEKEINMVLNNKICTQLNKTNYVKLQLKAQISKK